MNQTDPVRLGLGEGANDLKALICRVIIDEDDFKIPKCLIQDRLNRRFQKFSFPEEGDND